MSPRMTIAGNPALSLNVAFYTIDAAGFTGDAASRSDLSSFIPVFPRRSADRLVRVSVLLGRVRPDLNRDAALARVERPTR
jgi:hypothetical protein